MLFLWRLISSQDKSWGCFIWNGMGKKDAISLGCTTCVLPATDKQPSVVFVGQAPSWRHRERHKERAREAAMGSLLFLWEEWHLEQRGQLCEHFCLRQADWQRPNTPSQINRPHRVGSLQDDSFMHTQENRNTRTHTQTIEYLYSNLP